MKCEWIDNWADLKQIESDWRKLLPNSSADTIFLTWEWLWSCCAAVSFALEPQVLLVRNDTGDLLGIAPFYLQRYRLLNRIPIRILQLIPDVIKGSEYLDFVVDRRHESMVYQAIGSELRGRSNAWDCIWMRRVAGWGNADMRLLSAFKPNRLNVNIRKTEFAAFDLPTDFSTFEQGLASRQRSSVRKAIRDAFHSPECSLKLCRSSNDVPKYLEALFRLHFARWQIKGQIGAFEKSPAEAKFYEIFAPIALRNEWLRIYAIEDGNEYRAVQLGFLYNGIFSQMQEGLDPEYSRGSGNALRAKVIESLISENVELYDFLGGYTEHKRRWTARKRPGFEFLVGSRSVIGRLLTRSKLWPSGRFLTTAKHD